MSGVALVTGGSRGIGAETALLLARAGLRVAVGYEKNEEAAQSVVARIRAEGGEAIAARADIADAAQARAMVSSVRDAFGAPTVLVNSAGAAFQKLLIDMTEDEWNRVLAVNLSGAYHVIGACLPDMLSARHGAIVTVSSMWGQVGGSCEVAYSAAKAGLIGLTRALAKEVGLMGVRVNCVAPGVIDTDMNANLDRDTRKELALDTPLCRLGTAREVAECIAFLASDKASFVTGQVLGVNGGFVL